MAIDLYNDPALLPDEGELLPEEVMGGELAAPYVQGGANGQFGADMPDHQKLVEWIDHPNIADELEEDQLNKIGQKCKREFELDLSSREAEGWDDQAEKSMDLALQVAKEKTFPWPKASNFVFPLMTMSAIQFAARAYPAIIQGRNVVKGVVVGKDEGTPMVGPDGQPMMQPGPDGQPQPVWQIPPGGKRERAGRIGEHMSWQLLKEMKEWEEETDKLLHVLPIVGCAFRKSFFDPSMGCNASMLAMPLNVVVNFWAKSMERAARISEMLKYYPSEIEEFVRGDLFLKHDYGRAEGAGDDDDAPHDFIEQHRRLDLDEDGYPEPYIVMLHKQTNKVARIVARYDADCVHISKTSGEIARINPVDYYTKYDFIPHPKGGIYGVGFGQLLGPINEGVNGVLNMMFDAGTLQNTGGGFIGRGLSMHSGSVKFKLGEWKVVNAPGQTVRDAIVPMQHQGPNAVLFSLVGLLIEAGKDVSSIKDVLTGETAAATMQPTTLLALIEQGTKVFTAIWKRVYRAAGHEYEKLYRLNRIYLEEQSEYQIGDQWKTITREDYAKGSGVEPIADPSMVSDMQRMARAQFLQSYQNDPMCDGVEIRKRVFDAAQIEGVDKLVHGQMPPNPEILAKTAEMELKGKEIEAKIASEKAKEINLYADTWKKLAETDQINGEQPLELMAQYADLLRMHIESLAAPAEGQPKPPPAPHPDEIMGGPPLLQASQPEQPRLPPIPFAEPPDVMSFHNAPFARPGGQ